MTAGVKISDENIFLLDFPKRLSKRHYPMKLLLKKIKGKQNRLLSIYFQIIAYRPTVLTKGFFYYN